MAMYCIIATYYNIGASVLYCATVFTLIICPIPHCIYQLCCQKVRPQDRKISKNLYTQKRKL